MGKRLVQLYYRVYTYNYDYGKEGNILPLWYYKYSNSNWEGHPEDFFDHNLIPQGQITSKLSIQAPPGAIIELNAKKIIVGRSGLYDLDNENIEINSLVFPRPQVYQRSETVNIAKKEALEEVLRTIYEDIITSYGEDPNITYATFCKNFFKSDESREDRSNICFTRDYSTSYIQQGEEINIPIKGFQQAADIYIDILNGEPEVQDGDLENVVVNYITTTDIETV